MLAFVPAFVRPPPLASSLSAFHAEAPLERAMWLDGPDPATGSAPSGPAPATGLAQWFVRYHRLGKTSLYVTIAGYGISFIGTAMVFTGELNCWNFGSGVGSCSTGIPTPPFIPLGGVMTLVGGTVMFVGALEAAYDARSLGLGVSPAVGWVGVGLLGAAGILGVANDISQNGIAEAWYTAAGLGVAGLICGAVQLGEEGHAAGANGPMVEVVPTSDGVMVAGAF